MQKSSGTINNWARHVATHNRCNTLQQVQTSEVWCIELNNKERQDKSDVTRTTATSTPMTARKTNDNKTTKTRSAFDDHALKDAHGAHLVARTRERKREFQVLKAHEDELRQQLLDEAYSRPTVEKSFVSESELESLRERVSKLVAEKHKRIDEVRSMSKRVERILADHKLTLNASSSLHQLSRMQVSEADNDNNNNNNNNKGFEVPIDTASMARLRSSLDRLVQRRDDLVHEIDMLRECIVRIWSSRSECLVHNAELLHALQYTSFSRELLVAELERCERHKQTLVVATFSQHGHLDIATNGSWLRSRGTRPAITFANAFSQERKLQRSAIELARLKQKISDHRKTNRAETVQKNR